jgi:molybdopterin-binding protein
VKVDISGDKIITVVVTDAALKELDAKVGDELEFIKETCAIAARDLH